jgi:hypothetical protein
MKKQLLTILTAVILLLILNVSFGQAPKLGTAGTFVLFSANGSVSNTGISQVTGNVGSNSTASTAFGNVNGIMHDTDTASVKAAADLLTAYNQLDTTTATFSPSSVLLGNGDTLLPGVYSYSAASTLNAILNLDAKGDANAVFIFKIAGALDANASSKINLMNGALACNIFWKIEGAVNLAAGTKMRGTVIANNGAINLFTGDTLEGRALSTNGAVSVNGVLAYIPVGCGGLILTGPTAPVLASTECYALFTANGALTNTGITTVKGDVGTNVGSTTGYDSLLVDGTIHKSPDGSTATATADLLKVYTYLNTLPDDIELLYPAQFGNSLVLTPHTYVMKAAAMLTDTIFLNALGNANAVFVIKINGALTTSTYANVVLLNGAQSKNVYWKVEGSVNINDYSIFRGTVVGNGGAIGALFTGVKLDGRLLLNTGALSTAAMSVITPTSCSVIAAPVITAEPTNQTACEGSTAIFTVTATGSGLTYQWKKGNSDLTNVGNISGATTDSLTISPVNSADAASNYYVIITGSIAPADTSSNVALLVNTAPSISSGPADSTVFAGAAVSFNVIATGPGLSYQWRKGTTDLTDGGNISGTTSAELIIDTVSASDSAKNYNVVISGLCLPNATSANAALSVLGPTAPMITLEPTNQTACDGSSVSYSVTATGAGLTYQWKKGTTDLTDGGNISGATYHMLTINPVNVSDAASNYTVVVTGTIGPADTSSNVSLIVNTAPNITSEPADKTVSSGSAVSFTVVATGPGLTYQWRKGTADLTDGGNISGTTSAELMINPAMVSDSAYNYNVVITGTCLSAATSANASLSVTGSTGVSSIAAGNTNKAVTIYPNPFSSSLNIMINDASQVKNFELKIYNVLGNEVINTRITKQLTTIEIGNLSSGIYFFKLIDNNKTIQTGKLISKQ